LFGYFSTNLLRIELFLYEIHFLLRSDIFLFGVNVVVSLGVTFIEAKVERKGVGAWG
jgi:hypothetical protein